MKYLSKMLVGLLCRLALVLAVFVVLSSNHAVASGGGSGSGGGGGGGGGAIPQIAGTWYGQVFFPSPPQTDQGVMTLSEDASGNITGTVNFGPQFAIVPVTGSAKNDGTFQLKMEGAVLNGAITGPTTCVNGSTGITIGGSVQERGATGWFTFSTCPPQ